jgi:HD-GYP domain-containing protein (c-di-GMP phosphodiesterase class II)
MLRLSVKDLKKGMIVAQSIYNNHGGSYLVRGSAITPEYIRQLQKIGIPTVNVTSADPNFQLLPPEDVVQETTRIDAIQHVFEAFQSIEQEGRLDAEAMERVSDNILIDLIQRKENLIQLTDIRLHDTYTFAHSVNVAILSAMLGLHCHYTKKDLTLLTLGALLHDLGKIGIPAEILTKNTRLTDEEFATIKQHPELGAKRIHEMDHILPSTSLLAAIAREHHEHVDGRGYPRGLDGEKIHRFAKIVAIADVYDALTSERPYKRAYTPNVAYNIMKNVNIGQFDETLLDIFFNNVAIYPVGTILKTTWGYAIVKQCEFGKTESPTIILFADLEGKVLKEPITIHLADDPRGTKAIQMVIADNELRHFIHSLSVDPSIYLQEA